MGQTISIKIKTMKTILSLLSVFILFLSCETKTASGSSETWKQEIRDAELQFAEMVKNEGIHNAFVAYAADDATMMRNNTLVKGKTAIDEFYKNTDSKTLDWAPDLVDVSASGDLGYTYGTYHFTYQDSLGESHVNTGIFHTVWKRQADGAWKFVWD